MNDDLVIVRSRHSYAMTLERFRSALEQAGLTVFAEIDHGANATAVNLQLRPTVLLVFGNPRGGTPLMQMNQTVALDLPLRAVVWEDDAGVAWITHNDPRWLSERYRLGPAAGPILSTMSEGMKKLTALATD